MIATTKSGRFFLGASARLLDAGDAVLKAWAEEHVRKDPHIKWILGNYVEAGRANSNGHIFELADLPAAQESLVGQPLNMLHHEQYVVGSYAGSKLLSPDGDGMDVAAVAKYLELRAAATDTPTAFPYMEALAGMWHTRFPDEYKAIARAHGEGTLFFSMEAVPPTVTCPECSLKAKFVGLTDEAEPGTYCSHMNGIVLPKILNQPMFAGGAIIIPPVRPGWNRADVKAISELVARETDMAESLYAAARQLTPHLNPKAWEIVMAMVLEAEAKERADAS